MIEILYILKFELFIILLGFVDVSRLGSKYAKLALGTGTGDQELILTLAPI